MSTHYEVALYGDFFSKDLKPILNRLTLHSESAAEMHIREVVFEPLDSKKHRDMGVEPNLLRCSMNLLEPDSGWDMHSYLKPESVRQHPEATVRAWALCHVAEDALSFASALGYVQRTQLYKRGYAFRRGPIVICMFQQEQVDPRTKQPIPAHENTLWEVEVKTAHPVRNTQEMPISRTVDAVLEVQLLMRGLLDLRRKDV